MALWQQILLGILALALFFWFRPGLKAAMQRSAEAPKDWKAVLLPLLVVIAFIILLIYSVR